MADNRASAAGGSHASDRDFRIAALNDWCFRDKGSTCTRCFEACPKAAISFSADEMPVVDESRCSLCGICLAVCDDFANNRVGFGDLWKRIEYLAEKHGKVYLACRESLFPGFEPAMNVVILPCLASLSPEFWTLLCALDVDFRVHYKRSDCEVCDVAAPHAPTLFEYAARRAQDATGHRIRAAKNLPEQKNLASEFIKSGEFGRRGILESTLNSVNDLATGEYSKQTTDPSLDARLRRERMSAEGRMRTGDRPTVGQGAYVSRVLPPKSELVREIERRSPEAAAAFPHAVSVTDERLCDNCASPTGKSFDCCAVCPTHARRKVFGAETLDYAPDFCIGCGLCTTVCPHHAIRLSEG